MDSSHSPGWYVGRLLRDAFRRFHVPEDKALSTVKKVHDAVDSVAEHVQPVMTALAQRSEGVNAPNETGRVDASPASLGSTMDMRQIIELMVVPAALEQRGAEFDAALARWKKQEATHTELLRQRLLVINEGRRSDPEIVDRDAQNLVRRYLKYTRPVLELALIGSLVALLVLLRDHALLAFTAAVILGSLVIVALSLTAKLSVGESVSLLEVGRLIAGFGTTLVSTIKEIASAFREEKKDGSA